MGCCCSCLPGTNLKSDDESVPILEVDEIMKEYVWQHFLEHLSPIKRRLARCQRSRYEVDLPIKYFRLEEIEAESKWRKPSSNNPEGAESKTQSLETKYVNDTDEQQQYKFRLERARKTTMSVAIKKGFTIGGKGTLNVGLPSLGSKSKAGGEINFNFEYSKTATDTDEQTMTFETTSDINIPKESKVTVNVILHQKEVAYDYKKKTKLSFQNEQALARVCRKRDGHVCYAFVMNRLDQVFKGNKHVKIDHVDVKKKVATGEEQLVREYFVILETKGIVQGYQVADQGIELKAEKLSKEGMEQQDQG